MKISNVLLFFIISLPSLQTQTELTKNKYFEIGIESVYDSFTEGFELLGVNGKNFGYRIEAKVVHTVFQENLNLIFGLAYRKTCAQIGNKTHECKAEMLQLPIEIKYGFKMDNAFSTYIIGGLEFEKAINREKLLFLKTKSSIILNVKIGFGFDFCFKNSNRIGFEIAQTYSLNDRYTSLSSPGGARYRNYYNTNSLRFGFKYYHLIPPKE